MIKSLSELSDLQKEDLVASLATLLVGSSGSGITADALQAVATASGNTLSPALATLYSSVASKCPGGVKAYMAPPGGGGGGGGGAPAAGGGAAAAAAVVEKEEEKEEEEMDLGGGMDMFGGDEGGGGGDY